MHISGGEGKSSGGSGTKLTKPSTSTSKGNKEKTPVSQGKGGTFGKQMILSKGGGSAKVGSGTKPGKK